MVRVYTANRSYTDWPTFHNFSYAEKYIFDNSSLFDNGDIIAMVDFDNAKTVFIEARFTMTFKQVNSK